MKITRRALRQLILKEFRNTTFNGDIDNMISPPGGFSGFDDPRGGGGKSEAILKIYLGDYDDNVLKTIYGGTSEASVKRAIDKAIQEFERILKSLEYQGITGMEPDDFPDTMGPTNPSDIERQWTLLNYTNGLHMEAYPPDGGGLYLGGRQLYPNNPEYYRPSSSHGPVTNLILNIEEGNVWGNMAMWYILEKYPLMRIDSEEVRVATKEKFDLANPPDLDFSAISNKFETFMSNLDKSKYEKAIESIIKNSEYIENYLPGVYDVDMKALSEVGAENYGFLVYTKYENYIQEKALQRVDQNFYNFLKIIEKRSKVDKRGDYSGLLMKFYNNFSRNIIMKLFPPGLLRDSPPLAMLKNEYKQAFPEFPTL